MNDERIDLQTEFQRIQSKTPARPWKPPPIPERKEPAKRVRTPAIKGYNACPSKAVYHTQERAEAAAAYIHREITREEIYTYRCPRCGLWHLTRD